MSFLEKYPVSTTEALHYPLMFPENLKKHRIPGIPYAKLGFLYTYGKKMGATPGTIRTALSRMKKSGFVTIFKKDKTSRYRVSPLQVEAMINMQKKIDRKNCGFVVAVYSFDKYQKKERVQIRSLLGYLGFVRFAQNAYISLSLNESELRLKLDESGLSGNVYLFNVPYLDDQELSLMTETWKVPERTLFLEDFLNEMKDFFELSDGSPEDLFFRYGLAWVSYYTHVHSTELPLPEKMLPPHYPYREISEYLMNGSIREGSKLLRYFTDENR